MSTRKGETARKRPQKYQNTRAFKNDLHDKTVKTKMINNLQICNVCERCKSVLEWKIKYKKFKPLKAPGTCTKCLQKCVKHAYHIMCKSCAQANGVCPKCGKQDELVEPQPSPEELMKLDQEMQAMLKTLPERKRRTFLRYVEKNSDTSKKKRKDQSKDDKDMKGSGGTKDAQGEEEEDKDEKKGTKDLMAFLEHLKLSCKDGDDADDFDDFGDSDNEIFDSDNDCNDSDANDESDVENK